MDSNRRLVGGLSTLEQTQVLLVLVTGFVHVFVGFTTSFRLLTLAGFGFLGGAVLFLLGERIDEFLGLERGFVRAGLAGLVLPYTGYQFVAYYAFYGLAGFLSGVGAFDKAVQTVLLILSTVYLSKKLR